MVLKIQVEFDKQIAIQGGDPLSSMFIVLEPYSDADTTSTIPTFSTIPSATENGYKTDTFFHLGKEFSNAFETHPKSYEIQGKFLKLELDDYFEPIYRYIKNIHFFYEEPEDGTKIVRGDVPSELSKSTGLATAGSEGIVQTEDGTSNSELEPKLPFEIVKLVIKDEDSDKLYYYYTNTRSLNFKDAITNATIAPSNVTVSNFLSQVFVNSGQYFDTSSGVAQNFTLQDTTSNDIISVVNNDNEKYFAVQRDPTSGKLTEKSSITNTTVSYGSYKVEDDFTFSLQVSENDFQVDNQIKNPTLHAEIISSIGGEGYIALKMSKDTGNNFLQLVGVSTDQNNNITNNDTDRTIRHGSSNGDTDTAEHPILEDLKVYALENEVNPYTSQENIKFSFGMEDESNNLPSILDIVTGDELKVEVDPFGDDVILMRLDRFPRFGIDYSIDYEHQINLASGIFGPNGHAVLNASANIPGDNTYSDTITVDNKLQEVTATVGNIQVYYPPQKPSSEEWITPDPNFGTIDPVSGQPIQYEDFTAYYYVDISFKRGTTPVTITAKYDAHGGIPYTYQTQSGHQVHHGLILTKDNTITSDANSANGEVDEEITRTTIRNNNDQVVELDNTSFGTKLRIELPVAVAGIGSDKYPYDKSVVSATDGSKLTDKNFADLDSKSRLNLIDRQERTNGQQNGSYYYINVMDSLGNVVSPIVDSALQTDNDWGKATDSNNNKISPEIEKAEYEAQYVNNSWIKKVVLTFKHDLKEDTPGNITSLFNNEIAIDNDGLTIQKDSTAITQTDNEVSIKVQDAAAGSNNGTLTYNSVDNGDVSVAYTQETATDTIFNWLGFKIASFNKTIVLASGMSDAIPTISNISFAANQVVPPATSFSGDLTWNLSNGSTNGLTYKVEYSTSSDFATIAGTLTPAHTGGNNFPVEQTATISNLQFNTGYYFRVTPTNFEDGTTISTTTAFSQVGPAGTITGFVVTSNVGPTVIASWDKPANATQYKLEYQAYDYNNSNFPATWLDITGFSEFTETTDTNGTKISYTFDGNTTELDGNTQYQFKVSYSTDPNYPENSFGQEVQHNQIVTYPDEDYSITVENSSDDANLLYNSLKVSWTPETTDVNNTGDMGVGYEIEVSTSANFTTQLSNSPFADATLEPASGNIEKLITGLDASTTYYIRVRSRNADGNFTDQYSNYIPSSTGESKSTNLPPIPSPSNFALSLDTQPDNKHKITAQWDKPTAGLTYQYKLEVSTTSSYGNDIIATITSGFTETTNEVTGTTTVSITIDDSDITGTFSGNTTYYLRASIRQSADGTNYSNYGTPTSSPSPESITTVYDKITNSTAWGGDEWSGNTSVFGETDIEYINDGTNSGANPTIQLPSTPHEIYWGNSESPHNVSSLDLKLEIADNSNFTSSKVRYQNGLNFLDKSLNFLGMPDPETGAYYTTSGSGSSGITFHNTWIDTYTQPDPNDPNTWYASLNNKTDAFNQRKWFRIYVGNPDSYNTSGEPENADQTAYDGWGLYYEFDFLYLPGKPDNLSVPSADITATGFNVTWDIETDTLPTAPSGITYEYTYKVTYSTSSNFFFMTTSEDTGISHPTSGETKTHTLSNLSGNTNYYIKVSSSNQYTTYNSVKDYKYGIANDNNGIAILTLPPKVTGLSSPSKSDTSITLNWTAIGGETGATYTVEQWNGTNWVGIQTGITNNSHTITGLTSVTSYQFRVKATNASGDGEESDSITVTTSATPDTTPPSQPANISWQKSTNGSTWTTVDSNNEGLIKAGEYVRFNFTSTDANTISLSGNATLNASNDSGSSWDEVDTESTLNTDNGVTNGYYIDFQIPTLSTKNGTLQVVFTLTDGTNVASEFTANAETQAGGPYFTLDTHSPQLNASDADWAYSTDLGVSYTNLTTTTGSQILGPQDRIRVYIYPDDASSTDAGDGTSISDLDVTCTGVTIGANVLTNPGQSGGTPNPTVSYEPALEAWKLIYTIPALNTTNANGYLGFNIKLEDEAGNYTNTTNMNPPLNGVTITVDTVAPALESGGNPSLDPAVQTNGTEIKLYFTESLQTSTLLTQGFSISGTTLGNGINPNTATLGYHTQPGNNDVITLSGFGTIVSGETVSVSYSLGNVKDLAGNSWSPSNPISITNLVQDTTAPSLLSGANGPTLNSAGNKITLQFSEDLQLGGTNTTIPTSAFTVSHGGFGSGSISSVNFDSSDNSKIEINLSGLIYQGPTYSNNVTVSYAQQGNDNNLRDNAGNLLANFSGSAVTNNSSQIPSDISGPQFQFDDTWEFKRGNGSFTSLTEDIALKAGDQLKMVGTATDNTACDWGATPEVNIDGGDNNGSGTVTAPTPSLQSGSSDTYDLSITYLIDSSDEGDITFNYQLSDGNFSNSYTNITPPYTVTADNTEPQLNNSSITWEYETIVLAGEFGGGGGGSTWTEITSATTFGPDEKIRVTFTVDDSTDVSIKSGSAKVDIGGVDTFSPESFGCAESSTSGTYDISMVYTVPSTGTANANGVLEFLLTLEDEAGNELDMSVSNIGPSSSIGGEITIDTKAPLMDTSVTNYLELVSAGNKIVITFDEDLDVPAQPHIGFSIRQANGSSFTSISGTAITVNSASLDPNDSKKLELTLNDTIYGGEAPYLNYYVPSDPITDLYNNSLAAIPTQFGAITNNSQQIALTMAITSVAVNDGDASFDPEIDLTFTSSEKTNDFIFSDITLNNTTDGILSDFTTVFEVKVQTVGNSNKYFINGIQQDSLVLKSGNTYRFDQGDSTNNTHPLRFSTTSDGEHATGGTEYTTGVTVVGTPGSSGSYTEIAITSSTTTPLYYYCDQHSGMGGSVSIASTNLTKTDEYKATLTATAYTNYTINVAANKFTGENTSNNFAAEFSFTRGPWKQVGSDIEGSTNQGAFGISLALSNDGTRFISGEPTESGGSGEGGGFAIGKARVYDYSTGSWTQKGNDLVGPANFDEFGLAVAISGNGSVIAVGAGEDEEDTVRAGYVKIYEEGQNEPQGTFAWVQKGSTIEGEATTDEMTKKHALSLNNDGSIVAVGSWNNDGNGTNAGHVRVYEWDANANNGDGDWNQKGSDIDGSSGDELGWAVALSSNGLTVACGGKGGNGRVRVYSWNATTNDWSQIGSDIDGDSTGNVNDRFGMAIALSNNGLIVAASGYIVNGSMEGRVEVHEWDITANNGNGAWVQLGSDINAEPNSGGNGDFAEHFISLNGDGSIVGIGAPGVPPPSFRGRSYIYKYNSNTSSWGLYGQKIAGGDDGDRDGRSISLNDDGSIVAIGGHMNDDSGTRRGQVRVFEYIAPSTMTITSNTVTSGSSSSDSEIDLIFTASSEIIDFELSDITLNNTTDGTLSDFTTVFKVIRFSMVNPVTNTTFDEYKVNGIRYQIAGDGTFTGELKFKVGNTYRFDLSDSTMALDSNNDGRFIIATGVGVTPPEYTTGVTSYGTQGTSGAYIEVAITSTTPSQLYYIAVDANGDRLLPLSMRGAITITTSDFTPTDVYTAKLTTTAVDTYTINVAAKSFIDENVLTNDEPAPQFSWTRTAPTQLALGHPTGPGARILATSDDTIEIRFNKDLDNTISLMNATSSPPVFAFHVYARDSKHIEERVGNSPTTIESIQYYTWGGSGNNNGIKIKVGPGTGGSPNSDFFDDHFYSTDKVTLIYNSNATNGVTIKDTDGNSWSQSSTEEISVVNYSNYSYSISSQFSVNITSSDINSGDSTSETEIDLGFTTGEATNDFSGNDITVDLGATISDFATIFDVTVLDGKYYINYGVQKDLVLRKGETYRFDQSDSTNNTHPLRFSTTSDGTHGGGSEYTTGVTVVGTPGSTGAYTQIDIASNFSDISLNYYCSGHSGMGGEIDVITDGITVTSSKKFVAKHTASSAASTTFTIKVLQNTINNIQFTANGKNSASNTFSLTYNPPSWSLLGNSTGIQGAAGGDDFGKAVALSSDGSIVAVGAPYHTNYNYKGHVQVWGYNSSTDTWTQKGGDLDGDANYDVLGKSVSLSNDGSIVAMGVTGAGTGNDLDAGEVKVYSYNSSNNSWDQMGSDIVGETFYDESGHSVSLSGDGLRVAIGAIYNDDGGNGSGHVRVYDYSNNSWSQVGGDIDGEDTADESGYSVSLSNDGSRIAIGAKDNDGNGTYSGHVRVYDLSNNSWSQLGDDIDGESAYDRSGYSVSLSSDGSILAVGAPFNAGGPPAYGHVRVYEWDITANNGNGAWDQLGGDIDGETGTFGEAGKSVSLSSDGSIVAIGANENSAGGIERGHVRVYKYKIPTSSEWSITTDDNTGYVIKDGDTTPTTNKKYWVKIGNDAQLEGSNNNDYFGTSVSLSDNGLKIAIGAPQDGTGQSDKGYVKVYELS